MNLKHILFILLLIGTLPACKTIDIYSDHDPNAKFDSYSNFMVLEYMKSMPIDGKAKEWLHDAIHNQLISRGYNENKNPDLLVKVMIKTKTKETTSLQRNDNFYWGSDYYQYGWGINTGVNRINYNTHTEGTIIIDIIDKEKKELIWQGRATGAAKNGKKLTEASLNRIMKKLFTTYPLAPKN